MIITLFIGFVSGIMATLTSLHFIRVVRKSITRQDSKRIRQKPYKSPYSDINLMDTKYRDCG